MQADENGVEGAKVGSGDQQEEQGEVEKTVTRAVAAHLVLQEATMAKWLKSRTQKTPTNFPMVTNYRGLLIHTTYNALVGSCKNLTSSLLWAVCVINFDS